MATSIFKMTLIKSIFNSNFVYINRYKPGTFMKYLQKFKVFYCLLEIKQSFLWLVFCFLYFEPQFLSLYLWNCLKMTHSGWLKQLWDVWESTKHFSLFFFRKNVSSHQWYSIMVFQKVYTKAFIFPNTIFQTYQKIWLFFLLYLQNNLMKRGKQ